MASSADVPKSKIIASTNRVSLLLVGRKNISMKAFKWEMLKGKSVMGWPRGGDPGLMIERALRRMGLRAGRDIDHVTDLPIPARVRSWISGQADYAVFYEPFVTRFEKQGTGYAVASIAQATGNLDVGVFVATERFIREHPDRVQGWVSANRKALDWIRNNDAETVAKLLAPERRRWKLDELAGGFKRLREIDGWNWDLSISRRSISDWQSMMIESGVMRSTARLPYERLVDPRFFEAAAKIPMK